MTDPVNTDALRELVWRHGMRATVVTVDSDLVESAADELDRRRAEADDVYRDAYRLGQQHGRAVNERPDVSRYMHQVRDGGAALPLAILALGLCGGCLLFVLGLT